ncbi:MAG: Gram-negative bacterial TonB protein C-terminal [Pseudomonadota bacterium]
MKSHEPIAGSATSAFAISLSLHAIFALTLFFGFKDRQPPKTLTPIELVGPQSSASLRAGQDRELEQGHLDRREKAPRKKDPTTLSEAPKPKATTTSPADSDLQPPGASVGANSGSESGTSVGEGDFSTGSPLQIYVASIIKRIDEVKIYPEDAIFRGEEGRVVVAIHILPDGTIRRFHVTEPCPFESLNHAALDTISHMGRLPPLPENRNRPLTIRLPLNYELSRR